MVACAASSIPSSAFAVAATILFAQLVESHAMAMVVLLGITVALGLLAASAWHLARPYIRRESAVRSLIIVVTALMLLSLELTPIRVLIVAGAVGALWPVHE